MIARLAAVVLAALALAPAAAGAACIGLVAQGSPLLRASLAPIPERHVGLSFLGHASFLIESADGVAIVTDYSGANRPASVPDIVTMNRAHSTHYTEFPEPGITHVLRGWNPNGGPMSHSLAYKDVRIRNVQTNIRDLGGRTEFNGNSIFLFDIADLCIAHLGHLHHTLERAHLAEMGQVDVLLVPVDGSYTLDLEGMLEVIDAIKPKLVVPMHWFSTGTLNRFLAKMRERYPVKFGETRGIVLARDKLPKELEVLVLRGSGT